MPTLSRLILGVAFCLYIAGQAAAQNLSVTSGPAPQNGYPHTTTNTINLNGVADPVATSSVKVNGVAVMWTPANGTWSVVGVTVPPGVNRVLIQALDAGGNELQRLGYDVWYDDGSVQNVSGSISTNTTWTASGGPYSVTASLTIANGATLTVQPGTSVYLANGVNFSIATGGSLNALGTDPQPIRFTRAPGGTSNWAGMTVNGTANISYAHFEFNGSTAIHASSGTVTLDHLTFGNAAVQFLALDSSSFVVSRCIFPRATAGFEMVHGVSGIKSGGIGIIRDSYFGAANGYNDVIDFTGGNRPGPIIQFLNNVFVGSADDILDLDGTDAWVEGNIFLHVHRNLSPDSASGVSGGKTGTDISHVTIIGNIFYDVDQAATAKEGNFFTLINNTIVNQNHAGSQDTVTAVINLADTGIPEAAGMYLEGNIVAQAEALTRNYNSAVSTVTFNNNLLPLTWSGPGSGNSTADPRLKHLPTIAETNFTSWESAQVMRDWFSLLPGSPALGTGPNGRDKGAIIPFGASVSGEPNGTTTQTSATLTVGTLMTGNGIPTTANAWPNGSGFTHYKWRLDGGAWSAETPIGTPISVSGLAAGAHIVDVVGKNDAAFYQDDARFGEDATVTHSKTWVVDVPSSDTDGDGIPDSWEVANGLDPNDPSDAAKDRDGDGQSNLAEYFAGTNPRSATDVIRAIVVSTGGTPAIRFTAAPGKTYTVQFKNALGDAAWTKLTDVSAKPSSIEVDVPDSTASSQAQRFYRIVTPAQP